MAASRRIYDSPRLARQYAFDRPPLHPHLIRAIGARLHLAAPSSFPSRGGPSAS